MRDKRERKHRTQETVFFVKGMTCPACQNIISREIGALPGVKGVTTSLSKSIVSITTSDSTLSHQQLNQLFSQHGYLFSSTPFKNEGGMIKDFITAGSAAVVTVALFLSMERSGLLHTVMVDPSSNLLAFILFGVLAGISSCAAMVGGLVLSLSRDWNSKGSLKPSLLFNTGRIISYGTVGAILGVAGKSLHLSLSATAILVFAVSLAMVIVALQMLEFPGANRLAILTDMFRSKKDFGSEGSEKTPLLLGASTVLLPCGFSITVQGIALLSGDPIRGATVMAAFAAGTLPSLMAIGIAGSKLLTNPNLSRTASRTAGVLILIAAIYNVNSQLNVLGMPSLSDIPLFGITRAEIPTEPKIEPSKVQRITMEAGARSYSPNFFQVKAGIPVVWEIVDRGFSGCTNAVMAGELLDSTVPLSRGKSTMVEFTPLEAGRYKFSCWMGMVAGTIEVIP